MFIFNCIVNVQIKEYIKTYFYTLLSTMGNTASVEQVLLVTAQLRHGK